MHTKQYYFNTHICKYIKKEKFSKNVSQTANHMIMVTQETEIRQDQGKNHLPPYCLAIVISKGTYVFTRWLISFI